MVAYFSLVILSPRLHRSSLQFRINPPCAFVRAPGLFGLPSTGLYLRLLLLTFLHGATQLTLDCKSPFPNFNTPSPSAGNVAYTDNLAAESSASLSPPPRTHSHTGTHSAFTAKGACFPRRLLLELCVKSASSLLPRGGPARAPSLSTPCWIAGSRAAPTVPGEGGGRERGWGAGRKR